MEAPTIPPNCGDLHVTTAKIPRTPIAQLPGYHVTCARTHGWELWATTNQGPNLVAGEFHRDGLCLDVNGVAIVDSLRHPTGRRRGAKPAGE
jgi:hypothetical protein